LDAQGRAIVAGQTISVGMPVTPGAVQPYLAGSADAFALRLDPTGQSIEWCPYLGGGHDDYAEAVHVDSSGVVTVGGYTGSPNFPVTPGAYKTSQDALQGELYALRMSADATTLFYSTFVGGPAGGDQQVGMDVGPAGDVALTAVADKQGFPVTATAFDP